MAKKLSQGYDDPVSLRKYDHLNRWSFAREIFSIAETAPSDWSVRLGIYGAWGTGKTSVLKFIEDMAQENNHVVVNLNPWSYQSTDEMWEAFIKEVYKSLKGAALEMKDLRGAKIKSWFRKILKTINNTKGLEEVAEIFLPKAYTKIAKVGLSKLTGFLKANAQQLQKVPDLLENRRIIVLIDDLDRTDLNLLPEVLYALREVLDLPGFVFIMAFDPIVVGEALKKHHPGWGDGKRFLEKIIDFPRPLPLPTKKQLLNLAKSDINLHGNFIDLYALKNVFEFLPENPRKLRSFLRSLWGLKLQVERHDPTELNWSVLLLVQLLKFKYPDLTYSFFQNEQLVEDLVVSKLGASKQEETQQKFNDLYDKFAFNDENAKTDFSKIVDEIIIRIGWQSSKIQSFCKLAYLSEEPPLWTFKEVEVVLSKWIGTKQIDLIKDFITNHSQKIESSYKLVFIALFEKLVDWWSYLLEQAANALIEPKRISFNEQAGHIINLLEALALDLNGFISDAPILNENQFFYVMKVANEWIHFNNTSDYRQQRAKEHDFLKKIADKTTINPVLLLKGLEPWNLSRSGEKNSLVPKLFSCLDKIIEPKAAKQVPRYLKVENILIGNQEVFAYLMLRQEGTLWKSNELKQDILQNVRNANTLPIVQQNLLHLFKIFSKELETKCVQTSGNSEDMPFSFEFIHDLNIIEELWRGALATPINNRMISSYEKYRREIKKHIDVDLAVPDSWDQWLSQIDS